MSVDLADYTMREDYGGDYASDIAAIQQRIERIQVAHIVHGHNCIILFEGWDAAGKGGIIKRLTSCLDPCYYNVWPIAAPSREEEDHHFLRRFWERLPAKGEMSIFDRSWYGRVLVERVEGYASAAEWQRGYDEINEFEAQVTGSTRHLIKLFVHITQEEQDRRFIERLANPWKRWKTNTDDYRNRARRADYLEALDDMFVQTDTRWSPWCIINGNCKKAARIAALTHIAETLEAKVSMIPSEADARIVDLATSALGYRAHSE